ncbi:SseB family protein [Pseudonocardia sp. GCM10023141]|uniref:SseB family protein n=1 Tax=Pseudonocardia sp. GCM10023141 TaxID=3252653 RepID=UPI00362216AF
MELRQQIAAMYARRGDPDALVRSFRRAELVVALTDDDAMLALTDRGVQWLCAFTSTEALARFAVAREAGDRSWSFRRAAGAALQDSRGNAPLGVAVDLAGEQPMLFPPAPGQGVR